MVEELNSALVATDFLDLSTVRHMILTKSVMEGALYWIYNQDTILSK